jgi:cell division protein FtsI (penicillin-binding protein 3)
VLAHSVEARYVYADPTMVDDPQDAAAKLSPLLGIPVSELLPLLREHDRPGGGASRFEWLARGVDISVGDAVRALSIKGVEVKEDQRRDAPGEDLAANIIGFVGTDMHGLEGLEARYDELLYGINGKRVFESGLGDLAAEIPGGYVRETPAQPGSSLELTIDRDLQYVVQQELSAQARQVTGSLACAIVLDIKTGEMLANATYPTYNASAPSRFSPEQRRDVCTGVVVDPGSVHKAITIGAALEEGVVTADSAIPVEPAIYRGDRRFSDTHAFPRGTMLSIPGILAYSSNVGTIRIAEKLTPQKLYEYQRRFGLGEPTGVMDGEAEGQLLPPEQWSGSSYGSVPVGHSVAVTPLQMAAVYAAIANDGVWVRPQLIRGTTRPDGTRVPTPKPESRRVISATNAAALRQMMEAVVTVEDATGRSGAVPGYRVAGKTGTGARVENGKYVPGEVASFIGMAPAEAPRYVVAVFVQTPGGGGGQIAGPAFRKMMEFTLFHYKVPPAVTAPPKFVIRH